MRLCTYLLTQHNLCFWRMACDLHCSFLTLISMGLKLEYGGERTVAAVGGLAA